MVIKKAVEDAECWIEANKGTKVGLNKETKREKKWEPPRAEFVKCNVRIA